MEPRNDESQKPQDTPQEEKPRKRRFQIVKLEERIAPGGANSNKGHCYHTYGGCYSHHKAPVC